MRDVDGCSQKKRENNFSYLNMKASFCSWKEMLTWIFYCWQFSGHKKVSSRSNERDGMSGAMEILQILFLVIEHTRVSLQSH